jgi:hypothetical protein
MTDPVVAAREKLLEWIRSVLERPVGGWNRRQVAFLHSLLEGQEGTKTLAELAVTSARIRASGLQGPELGLLQSVHQAIEAFWNNPGPGTYEKLRAAGRKLHSESAEERPPR